MMVPMIMILIMTVTTGLWDSAVSGELDENGNDIKTEDCDDDDGDDDDVDDDNNTRTLRCGSVWRAWLWW